MKYTVIINDRIFDKVSDVKPSRKWRSESSSKNLGGELLIDRIGSEKTELKITVGGLSEDEMAFLREERGKMETKVKYYVGDTLVEKAMHFNPFTEPAPLYYYGDRKKGIIYPNVTLSFSEI